MEELETIAQERKILDRLREVGMSATKSVLLTGPPGVGKTVAATWIAQHLNRPLLTLDLASVMSKLIWGRLEITSGLSFTDREVANLSFCSTSSTLWRSAERRRRYR